ncbi:MAG: glycine cleavage system protein GcvH [Gemmatimonadetes bacterium]|nr:glycine cleavage system protein GcvH [Gemmatimonadota bacterium]
MADVPTDLLYTEEHEYLKPTGDEGIYFVGITDYAQGELGDVVFVELPKKGDRFARMEVFGTVEAVKAVSDLYAPVSAEVIDVNAALADDPALVNADPYGKGWMLKVRVVDTTELDQLLGADEYARHIAG